MKMSRPDPLWRSTLQSLFCARIEQHIDELNNHNIDFETLENIKIDDENLQKNGRSAHWPV